MIHFLYREDLGNHVELAHSMFVDRGEQFKERLGWAVDIDESGEEQDEYDLLNPLYVIVANEQGKHEASMRLLPTTGSTMVNEHFSHVIDGVAIQSPFIWECTRFCVSKTSRPNAATKLMAAGGKLMQEFEVEHFVGVFDRVMLGVYRRLGATPTVVGWSKGEVSRIGVGLWEKCPKTYELLLGRCGMTRLDLELHLINSNLLSVPVSGRNRFLEQPSSSLKSCDEHQVVLRTVA